MSAYHIKRFHMLLLPALLASAMAARAQQVNTFSAQDAVDYAMKNTSQVKNALLDIQKQIQTNRSVTASALPQINGNVNYTNYLDIPTSLLPGEFFGQPGTYIPVQFGVKHNATYGIDLQQLLFDGQVFVGLQARRTTIDFADKALAVTKEQIKANVLKIYYQVLASRQQIATLDANIEQYEKLLSDTREIFNNGLAERLDVDKTEVTLTNLKTQKMSTANQNIVAVQGLKLLMGMPLKDSLVFKDSLPEEKIKEDIADTAYNYTDRKEFQQIKVQEKLYEYNVKRYKLAYLPSLSFNGNYSRNAQRQSFDFLKTGKQWFTTSFIGFKLSIPIFDGFTKDANMRNAKLDLLKTQNTIENLRLQIDEEVANARINMRTAIATMDYQKRNMALAQKVYNQTKLKFEQGLGSNTEITTAQSQLTTAQNNYYAALYDAIIARIDYTRSIGKL